MKNIKKSIENLITIQTAKDELMKMFEEWESNEWKETKNNNLNKQYEKQELIEQNELSFLSFLIENLNEKELKHLDSLMQQVKLNRNVSP